MLEVGMKAQPIYLVPEKAQELDDLTGATRIPKAALLREAVDDLLRKYSRRVQSARL